MHMAISQAFLIQYELSKEFSTPRKPQSLPSWLWLYIPVVKTIGRPHSKVIGSETSTLISLASGNLIARTVLIICSFSFENFADDLCLEGADIHTDSTSGLHPNFWMAGG